MKIKELFEDFRQADHLPLDIRKKYELGFADRPHIREKRPHVAPHQGVELELMIRGLKPAAIVIDSPKWMKAIKNNNWPYKEIEGSLLVGTTEENLNRLLNAFDMIKPSAERDAALGRALGYSDQHISAWNQERYGNKQ